MSTAFKKAFTFPAELVAKDTLAARLEAGASLNHNRITRNVGGLFWQVFKDSNCCEVFTSDMAVRSEVKKNKSGEKGGYYLPDVVVVCGEKPHEEVFKYCYQVEGGDQKTIERVALTNPSLIVEVISDGTAAKDRGEKIDNYECITTLKEYLIIDQNSPRITYFTKGGDNKWERVIEFLGFKDQLQGAQEYQKRDSVKRSIEVCLETGKMFEFIRDKDGVLIPIEEKDIDLNLFVLQYIKEISIDFEIIYKHVIPPRD